MVKRMLIDATHPEETRVVVVNGTRLEELDVETSTKRQLKGNIYLAKVVRVEPSLQAAFVEYGGNRHGFLAFSEIHPDYFQIPVADRQALLAAQRAEGMHESSADRDEAAEGEASETPEAGEGERAHPIETVGGDDDAESERRRARLLRNYKIQEVIKRRQIMLIQVVKEERGNKGAALTTYLSLAGRYCVLMPNTARGGGVSRKIVSTTDRRRLKAIANEIDVPEGMAVIIRTAGSERSKTEIRRDYEYLIRMWESVREMTLRSTAPTLVYEEASLIKRSIRDLYSRDIEEVLVDGDDGYRLAKDYMRLLTPSHAKKVQPYKDPVMPLFHRYQVETQLDAMHSPVVQLKSGGYIVIAQTEALVAIDVNSGRATRERHIEETALKTNLEAADEVARQLRLRDLAGLIVIDFIDMEEGRNNHAVERRVKEALKNDRARIQVGKISAFGLLELSRQRLRPSLQETTFIPCRHCGGTGLVRSVESAAVHVLRAIEEEGIRRRSSEVTVFVPTPIALYILNQKRTALAAIEARYEFAVQLSGDDELVPPAFRMERIKAEARSDEPQPVLHSAVTMDDNLTARLSAEEAEAPEPEEPEVIEAEEPDSPRVAASEDATEGDGNGGKRRRRRRRKRKNGEAGGESVEASSETDNAAEDDVDEDEPDAEGDEGEGDSESDGDEDLAAGDGGEGAEGDGEGDLPRKRRRGRRGGRRRRRREDLVGEGLTGTDGTEGEGAAIAAETAEQVVAEPVAAVAPVETVEIAVSGEPSIVADSVSLPAEEAPAPVVSEPPAASVPEAELPVVAAPPASVPEPEAEGVVSPAVAVESEPEPVVEAKPKRVRAPRKKVEKKAPAAPVVEVEAAAPVAEEKPKRRRAAPRKKVEKAVAEEVAPTVAAVPVEPEAAAPVADVPPAVAAVAAEAVPVVVVTDAPAAAPAVSAPAPAEEAPAPLPVVSPRRGWWSR